MSKMLKRNLHLFWDALKHTNALKLCHNSLWNISTQIHKILDIIHMNSDALTSFKCKITRMSCLVILWISTPPALYCEITDGRQRWTEVVINTKYSTRAQKACLLKSAVLISQGRRGQRWSRGGSRAPDLTFFSNSCQVRASSHWWYHVESRGICREPSLICSAANMS